VLVAEEDSTLVPVVPVAAAVPVPLGQRTPVAVEVRQPTVPSTLMLVVPVSSS